MSPSTKRKNWSKVAMCCAIRFVRNGVMLSLRASKYFSVPRRTLKSFVKDISRSPEKLVNVYLDRRTVLPREHENKLAECCITMD
jgi:hypothetical protein